jgi:hypothetical protein
MTPLFYEDSLGDKIAHAMAARRLSASERQRAARSASLTAEAGFVLDADLIDDPSALSAAEILAAQCDPLVPVGELGDIWVTVFGPAKISGIFDAPWPASFIFTAPLAAADIPIRWQPYPPELMPGFRAGDGAVDRPFSLQVPKQFAVEASAALAALGVETSKWGEFGVPLHADRTDEANLYGRDGRILVAFFLFGLDLVTLGLAALFGLFYLIIHGARP